MAALRWFFLLGLLGSLLCFGAYLATGQLRWRRVGLRVLSATVIAALVFFGVLILERTVFQP